MKKTLLIFLFLIIFLTFSVSALKFDNSKDYNADTKEAVIKNRWGIGFLGGGEIARIKLNSNLVERVGLGYQKVAELELNAKELDYFFDGMEFYNYPDMMPINRQFDFKVLSYEETSTPLYEEKCTGDIAKGNRICESIYVGNRTEETEKWTTIDKDSELAPGVYTIGIFTTVEKGDYVEWIPRFYGVEIEEWARWEASLYNDIVAYYTFNETSGDLINVHNGKYNQTISSVGRPLPGLIGTSYNFSNNLFDYTHSDNNITEIVGYPFTVDAWVNISDFINQGVVTSFGRGDSDGFHVRIYTDSSGQICVTGVSAVDDKSVCSNEALNNGRWQYVAYIFNSTGIHLYINSTYQGKTTAFTQYPLIGQNRFAYGRLDRATPTGYYRGNIDESGIWNRSLTEAEIISRYNNGVGVTYGQKDSVFSLEDVNLIVPENNTISTNTSYNFTYNYTVYNGNITNATLQVWNSTNNLVNETTEWGYAKFNGVNQSIINQNNIDLYLNRSQQMTVSAWINPYRDEGNGMAIISGGAGCTSPDAYDIYRSSVSNLLKFNLGNTGGGSSTLSSNSIIPSNKFTHISITLNGTTRRIYINGILDAEESSSTYLINIPSSTTYIGRSYCALTDPNTGAFDGSISKVEIMDRALNSSEVLEKYQEGRATNTNLKDGLVGHWRFDTGSGTTAIGSNTVGPKINGTLINSPNWTTDAKRGAYALNFDNNSNQYVNIGNYTLPAYSGNMSISLWFKTPNPTDKKINLLGEISSTVNRFLRINSNGEISLEGDINNDRCKSNPVNYLENNWYNLVVISSGGNCKFYFNSQDAGLGDATIGSDVRINSIGLSGDGGILYMNGTIDDVRIYDRELSEAEIKELYNDVAYYKLDLPTEAEDSTNLGNDGTPQNGVKFRLPYTFEVRNFLDGRYFWNVLLTAVNSTFSYSTNQSLTNNTFLIDNAGPVVSIISPSTLIEYGYAGKAIDLNYSVIDDSLDSCWYNYNGTNVSLASCGNTTFSLDSENKSITLYANDTLGSIGSDSISWNYTIFENYQEFENPVYESSIQSFTLNITLASGIDILEGNLNYNGISTVSQIFSSGNDRLLNVPYLEIPAVNLSTNNSFLWELTLVNGTHINSTINNQIVYAINLSNCEIYNNTLLNLSLKNERDRTLLNGTIEIYYEILNKPTYNTVKVLNGKFENVNSLLICSQDNLAEQNLAYSAEIKYYADDHVSELYNIQRADITNITPSLSLYDLDSNYSTQFKIVYQDDSYSFVEGAIIQLQRKYIADNAYEIVEAPLTSNEGTTQVHIDLDSNIYRATVVKNGEILDEFENLVFICENPLVGTCTQQLLGSINPRNDEPIDTLLDFSYYDPIVVNETVSFSFSVPSGSPAIINISLVQKDQFGNNTLCSRTLSSSAGSIECEFSKTIGDSYIDLLISKNGYVVVEKSYVLPAEGSFGFLGNNFIIVFLLLLSLVGMAYSSPEWIIINGVLTLLIAGALWLLNGLEFVVGLGTLMWLIIAAAIMIFKIAKQEDR